MKIITEFTAFKISTLTGKLSSNIYIRLDESLCFPSCGWVDFSLSLLNVWTRELIQGLSGKSKVIVLYFMEGDHAVQLKKYDGIVWKSFFGSYSDYGELFEKDTDYPQGADTDITKLAINIVACNETMIDRLRLNNIEQIKLLIEGTNELIELLQSNE